MIKAIFFDIDGTLVSLKTKVYPPSAKLAIEALRKRGILCFVATGRSKFEIVSEHMLDGLTFDGYLTCNGQAAYDDPRGKLLYGAPIEPQEVSALLDWVEREGCTCWFVGEEDNRINRLTPDAAEALAAIHTKPPRTGDLRRMLERPVYKIILFAPHARVLDALSHAPHCRKMQWFPCGHDIIHRDGGKRNAMLGVLSRYGIAAEECMAFGDADNDLEMLRTVGIGVAMGNATPDALAAADYITADCDDDGVLKALQHFELL